MKPRDIIYAHFIDEQTGNTVFRQLISFIPRRKDEVRVGGEGKEKYYKVTRVIWVYDEPDCPYMRVNIGIIGIKEQHEEKA